jgi:hypothetical protein
LSSPDGNKSILQCNAACFEALSPFLHCAFDSPHQVLQRRVDRELSLYDPKDRNHVVAHVAMSSLTSQPVDHEENGRRKLRGAGQMFLIQEQHFYNPDISRHRPFT